MSDLIKRAILTSILAPAGVALIIQGSWFYFIPVTIILLVALYEYLPIANALKWTIPPYLLFPAIFLQLLFTQLNRFDLAQLVLMLSFFALMLYVLWLYEYKQTANVTATWFAALFAIFFFGWLGSHFFLLRQFGWEWTILAIVGTWSADSGAYLSGRFFGKNKLAPRLSPKKTVEGYLGGILLGTLIPILIGSFLELNMTHLLIIALPVAALGTFGDLAMSLLKRESGIKDSGQLFLNHGGAIDRIDSVIWAVTISYYLLSFLTH